MARLLIWCLVWMQVHWSKKGSCWKYFWSNGEQSKKVAVTSRRPHVAMSQRHDVRSTMHKSTIRNVVTFQRRDVPTSRRRDVSTGSALHHLKHEWFGKKGGHREAYKRGHGIPEQSDVNFEEVPVICTVSHFLDIRMMFLRLNNFIFSFSMF